MDFLYSNTGLLPVPKSRLYYGLETEKMKSLFLFMFDKNELFSVISKFHFEMLSNLSIGEYSVIVQNISARIQQKHICLLKYIY